MTTAHRPTWHPCRGGEDQGGTQIIVPTRSYSARDLPGYLFLKERTTGQDTVEDLSTKDFKKDLLDREKKINDSKKNDFNILKDKLQYSDDEDEVQLTLPKPVKKQKLLDETINMLENTTQNQRNYVQNPFPEDEDDADFQQSDEEDQLQKDKKENKDNSDSDVDEDEDEILMKEFQRLKQQKEEDQKLKAQQKESLYENNMASELLKGNPLLEDSGNYSLNKRWYEETVFKNQAKIEQKAPKRRFINDNVRNEFHYKFMARYLQTG